MAQSYLGEIKNKPICSFGAKVTPVAAAVVLTKGMVVYQDAALGTKVVPTSSQPAASRIRVIENGVDNSAGILGTKSIESYKHGCIAVVKLQGNMTIDGKVRASLTTAGSVAEIADPTDLAEALVFNISYLADYLGHPDEYLDANKQVTAAINGEEIVVAFK